QRSGSRSRARARSGSLMNLNTPMPFRASHPSAGIPVADIAAAGIGVGLFTARGIVNLVGCAIPCIARCHAGAIPLEARLSAIAIPVAAELILDFVPVSTDIHAGAFVAVAVCWRVLFVARARLIVRAVGIFIAPIGFLFGGV